MNTWQSALVIDDHPIFRHGMVGLLATLDPALQVAQVGSLEAALALGQAGQHADLLLYDLNLPGLNGPSGLGLLRGIWPRAVMVVVSSTGDSETVAQCIENGASGFIHKSADATAFIEALENVLAGRLVFPGSMNAQCPVVIEASAPPAAVASLSRRQREVLQLVLRGWPNKLIAAELSIAESTVADHVGAVLRALNVRSRTQAVLAMVGQADIRSSGAA